MKLNDVYAEMPIWYEEMASIYLKSAPGMGKTTTILEAPRVLSKATGKNIGCVVIQGPLLTPGDAIGYLMPKHCEDGRIESAYSEPFWFKTYQGKRLSEFDGGIVFVDEMDKADTDVKKVLGECALSGRLGPHRLNGGWVLWGAGNRAEDRSGSTKELDHLINRRREIDIQPDLDSLIDWMDANGTSPLTKSYTRTYPETVLSGKVPEKQGPWCTPRSLVAADKYIHLKAKHNNGVLPTDPITVENVTGNIGAPATATYFSHVKLQLEMPEYKSIIAAPEKAKLPVKPDALMLVCYNLAHLVNKDDAPQVIKYVERMPKEFAVTFAKAATKREPLLVMAPAFRSWAQTNASLMAVIR
jgi:hypothetical protein